MRILLCCDCKWFDNKKSDCRYEKNLKADFVCGGKTTIYLSYTVRAEEALCGIVGKWWEAKEGLQYEI